MDSRTLRENSMRSDSDQVFSWWSDPDPVFFEDRIRVKSNRIRNLDNTCGSGKYWTDGVGDESVRSAAPVGSITW